MKMMILGAGYSGRAIARASTGRFDAIFGTTRSPSRFDALRQAGIRPLVFDNTEITDDLKTALANVTHLVQSISPDIDGDGFLKIQPDLRALLPNLAWIGYLSTVGVYGDHGGQWVDESAILHPVSKRSRERVLAENQWRAAGTGAGIPVAVLRLSGIYGPGRNNFINLENGTARRLIKPDQVFNRIRVEDIAGFTAFLIGRNLGGIYNVTDDRPAPAQDVVEYAAHLMGVPVPPDVPFEAAELSPMARSFYSENKRVANTAMRATGYEFLHPNYEESFSQMWKDQNWR